MAGHDKKSIPQGQASGVPTPIGKERDRTVQFARASMAPPDLQESEFLSSMHLGTPGKIKAMLAGCTPIQLPGNVYIDFGRLLNGLVGATRFLIRSVDKKTRTEKTYTILLAQTARSSFMVYKMTVESLYDVNPVLIGAEFKNRCMLRNKDNEMFTMSVVGEREIKAVMSISVEDPAAVKKAPVSLGTIAPTENTGMTEFRFKLRSCTVLPDRKTGKVPPLNVNTFADSITFIAPVPAEGGSAGQYILYIGPNDALSYLYVNCEPPPQARRIADLRYDRDTCVLCRG